MDTLEKAKNNFLNHENYLSPYACRDKDSIRIKEEKKTYVLIIFMILIELSIPYHIQGILIRHKYLLEMEMTT